MTCDRIPAAAVRSPAVLPRETTRLGDRQSQRGAPEPPPAVDEVTDRFRMHMGGAGYAVLPSYPLRTRDETLLLTNSTVAPFKPDLRAGVSLGKVAVAQDCFRAHHSPIYPYAFTMLGMMADGCRLGELSEDLMGFLRGGLGVASDRLHLVRDPADEDLRRALDRYFDPERLHDLVGNSPAFTTRWLFGRDLAATGRGVTVAMAASQRQDEGQAGRLLALGNVICISTDDGRHYVDVGFGAEALAAGLAGCEVLELWPFGPAKALLQGVLSEAGGGTEAAKIIAGLGQLALHGIGSSPKGPGSIVRGLARDYMRLMGRDAQGKEAAVRNHERTLDGLRAVGLGPRWSAVVAGAEEVLEEEVERVEMNVRQQLLRLSRGSQPWKRRSAGERVGLAVGSYGLPKSLAEALVGRFYLPAEECVDLLESSWGLTKGQAEALVQARRPEAWDA